ncbi:hypothetical protein NG799_02135 [Laspinema sp. D1]|uniref:XRE family transcriptional regulator n=2 Tax=Laspinema TaxID=2584823 RepID=A0ABT2MKW8_9CYAN|nr:hypothetical protein [Laspinema sp. D3b]MCT7965132.1 hypothetical protein [Laspinema sp. D2a]MCT7977565.1 hypothetical protein [Laspinema sp. D3b]
MLQLRHPEKRQVQADEIRQWLVDYVKTGEITLQELVMISDNFSLDDNDVDTQSYIEGQIAKMSIDDLLNAIYQLFDIYIVEIPENN